MGCGGSPDGYCWLAAAGEESGEDTANSQSHRPDLLQHQRNAKKRTAAAAVLLLLQGGAAWLGRGCLLLRFVLRFLLLSSW